ncbi:MFS transporter [Rhizobacter sp. Root404]|uniref:MFS transporter n=1 Tax=Rhizobacter sp. Root404 TaxID=1736528 RepID=UPI0009EA27A1|nr:MFS transporter [Rhizobacter sp. Root404]
MSCIDRNIRLTNATVVVLSVVAGGAIASDYALQPALSGIAHEFNVRVSLITAIASSTMVGYIVGLALLVPLVDSVGARRIIPCQLSALAFALLVAALAPGPVTLLASLLLIGATTTVAAQCTAVVGKYSPPARRASDIGTIAAGISAGILLSRFVGGWLAHTYGWRGALLAFAAFAALAAPVTWGLLRPELTLARRGYLDSVREVNLLHRRYASLRRRTCSGMLWFFAFNLVWVGLAISLAAPPHSLNPAQIGLYSFAGVLGLAVIRPAGRLVDRFGSRPVLLASLAATSLCSLLLAVSLHSVVVTAVALALFDTGCFAAQVANQASIVAIDPRRAGSLSAAYLVLYYGAGAVGAAIAGVIVSNLGWTGIAVIAAAATTAAAWLASAEKKV